MLVVELRQKLLRVAHDAGVDPADEHIIKAFLAALARYDSVDVEALIKMFESFSLPRKASKPAQPVVRHQVADELKASMQDDFAFEAILDRVATDRKMTKPVLMSIYEALFGTLEGVPTKINRNDLIDTIRQERIKSARNTKMHNYLSGPTRRN